MSLSVPLLNIHTKSRVLATLQNSESSYQSIWLLLVGCYILLPACKVEMWVKRQLFWQGVDDVKMRVTPAWCGWVGITTFMLGPTFQLVFSWTLKISNQENGRFIYPKDSQRRGTSWVLQLKAFSETIFSKWINFQTRHCKEVYCHWNKISLSFQTARLSEANSFSPTVQLEFIWTFKMSDQQSYWFAKPNDNLNSFLNTCVTAKRLFKYNFFEMNEFRN